jgi:hypothetical protein
MFFASSKPWSVSLHITSPSTACSRGLLTAGSPASVSTLTSTLLLHHF